MWTYVHREFFDHIWAVYQCVELKKVILVNRCSTKMVAPDFLISICLV